VIDPLPPERYNYATFAPEHFEPLMRFEASPPLGQPAPDFPLWQMEDGAATRLSAIWSQHKFTVVEFGSFT